VPAHLSGEPKLVLPIEDGRCFGVDLLADPQQLQRRHYAERVAIHGVFASSVRGLPEEAAVKLRARWQWTELE
jgi:hypothetical protein